MTTAFIRCAVPEDAEIVAAILRDSITKLCVADHGNDPLTLEHWLRNETADHVARWIDSRESHVVVAELDLIVRGVATLHRSGEIRLCYVQPGKQRNGYHSAGEPVPGLGRSLCFPYEKLIVGPSVSRTSQDEPAP